MEDEAGVPTPEDSGSDGSQSSEDPIHHRMLRARHPMPMVDRLIGLTSANTRALGGEVTSVLVSGIASQMESDLHQARVELAELREKLEILNNDLSAERIKSTALFVRLEAFRSTRHLKNICIALGTLSLSLAYKASLSGHLISAIIPAIFGVLILFISWFSVPPGGEK